MMYIWWEGDENDHPHCLLQYEAFFLELRYILVPVGTRHEKKYSNTCFNPLKRQNVAYVTFQNCEPCLHSRIKKSACLYFARGIDQDPRMCVCERGWCVLVVVAVRVSCPGPVFLLFCGLCGLPAD